MAPHEQEGKLLRKIKPYPQVAPDEDTAMQEIESDLPGVLIGAAMAVLGVIFLFLIGVTVYVWSLVL